MQPYSLALRALHWIMAAQIVLMVTTGMMYFWEIGGDVPLTIHQISGQILIILIAARLIAKFRSAKVSHTTHAAWERALAMIVQIALYGLLIAFVVTGYVAASAYVSNALLFPVDLAFARSAMGETLLNIHYNLKWVLLGLLTLHISGALKHHFVDRDATLKSMWFTKH